MAEFLVFIAGFVVEIISKMPINIIQYLIIGAALVLFIILCVIMDLTRKIAIEKPRMFEGQKKL